MIAPPFLPADTVRGLLEYDTQAQTQVAERLSRDSRGQTVFERLGQVLDKWVTYAKNAVRKLAGRSVEVRQVRAAAERDVEQVTRLAESFRRLRQGAGAIYEAMSQTGEEVQEGGERYSIQRTVKLTYDQQMELRDRGQLRRNDDLVPMKNAIGLYEQAGLPNVPISLSGRISTKIKGKHAVSDEYIAHLDQHISSPYFLIDEAKENPQAVVAFLHEDKGKPVVSVIQKGVQFDGQTVNRIITLIKPDDVAAYARGLFDPIKGRGTDIIHENSQVRPESTPQEVTDILIKAAYGNLSQTGEEVKPSEAFEQDLKDTDGTETHYGDRERYSLEEEAGDEEAARKINGSAASDRTGVRVDAGTRSAYADVRLSLETYNESDYVKNRDKMVRLIAKMTGRDEGTVEKWFDAVSGIAATIAADRGRLDYTGLRNAQGELVNSALKPNAEYGGSIEKGRSCRPFSHSITCS